MGHWYVVHWLFEMGLSKDIVASCVASAITIPLGITIGYGPYSKNRNRQKDIADKLDVHTPGGLHDVVKLMKHYGDQRDDGVQK